MATESEPGRCHRRCAQEGLGEWVCLSPMGGRREGGWLFPSMGGVPGWVGEVTAGGDLEIKGIKLKLKV